jgi:hypothetical protein
MLLQNLYSLGMLPTNPEDRIVNVLKLGAAAGSSTGKNQSAKYSGFGGGLALHHVHLKTCSWGSWRIRAIKRVIMMHALLTVILVT